MHTHPRSPWFQRAIALLLLAASLLAALRPDLDDFAESQVEAGMRRALVAFALARALNGVISVAQSTEVALQPAGVGVSVAPGEILDPVNDLVEQFSTAMLVAAGSLGLQRLLIGASAWTPLAIALVLLVAGWLGATFTKAPRATRLLRQLALIAVVLRFSVPIAALASEGAYRAFLEPEYQASRSAIENASERLAAEAARARPQPPADEGLLDRTRRIFDETKQLFDVEAQIEALERTATEVTRHMVNLIAVFTVQTVVIPLLLMWLVWRSLLVVVPRAINATRLE
jgi:hypothetical protein